MNKPIYIAAAVVVIVIAVAVAIIHYEASETRKAIHDVTRPVPQEAIDSVQRGVDRVIKETPKVDEVIGGAVKAMESIVGDRSSNNDARSAPSNTSTNDEDDRADGSATKSTPPATSGSTDQTRSDRFGNLADKAFDLAGQFTESVDNVGQRYLALSPEEEQQWGKLLHEQMLGQQKVCRDAAMNRRLQTLAEPLVKHARQDIRFTFTILDSEEVNAFSMAGGYVYVNRALMKFVSDDAELQFVLGHEIGHEDLKHCSRQLTYVVRASEIATPVAGQMAAVLHDLISRPYTQDQEFAADAYGLKAIERIGRSPDSAISFLRRLGDYIDKKFGSTVSTSTPKSPLEKVTQRLGDHFRTHPPVEQRIRRLEGIASSEPAAAKAADSP